ncbi:heptaprenyl diphosphate synthase component 1 [Schinkia sp. CFF1]
MSVNDIYEEIEQIKADIDQRVKHPYLMKFIDVPIIEEQKLLLLYFILKKSNMPFDRIRQSTVATMLVQLALDTHELVGLHRIEDDNPFMKQRQLTVLGGDYYSGLYYYLLALVDDIPMLKILSTAIKEINEHKISVYHQDFNVIDEYLDSVAMIESLLVQKVAQYVGNNEMREFAKQLLLVNRLNREKNIFKSRSYSAIIDGISAIHGEKSGILRKIDPKQAFGLVDKQIMKSIHYVETFLETNSVTYSFLSEKVMAFINNLDIAMEKAVKEG